ncbi:TPA: hypothetical protein ACH3X1_009043 [Trebouxia sp. C0004]
MEQMYVRSWRLQEWQPAPPAVCHPVHCAVIEPYELYMQHREAMVEDFLHKARQATRSSELAFTPAVFNDSLLSIESYIQAHNKQLSDFPSMPCPDHLAQVGLPSRLMQAELAFELPALSNQVDLFEQQGNKDQNSVSERSVEMGLQYWRCYSYTTSLQTAAPLTL